MTASLRTVGQTGTQRQRESSGMKRVRINAPVGAVALWLVAAGLLAADTVAGTGMPDLGRWGLFATGGAVTATISSSLRQCRRTILEVLTWERWMVAERDRDAATTKVRSIHC